MSTQPAAARAHGLAPDGAAPPRDALLRAEGLRVGYGAMDILKGVSFAVAPGECFAVIGPNGAGKTTLFKAMTGEVSVRGGSMHFDGREITRLPVRDRARAGLGRTFQVARVFQGLTVQDNLVASVELRRRGSGEALGAWYAWRPAADVVAESRQLLDELGLAALEDTEARFLSHGDRKRLEIAITLAQRPRILMLDEPTAGMSHAERLGIVQLIRGLQKDKGMTVVMTEHDMDVIFGLADRIMAMNYGEIIATGAPEAVRADPLVREVYLGKELSDA